MKHKRIGFTIIEVALFLAITGLLFVGIAAGTQNSIWQQRFNDSTQNFAEFLRSIYSQVSNPQSVGTGRSDYAIYGKLIVFGETTGLDGNSVNGAGEVQRVFVYDVVGDAARDKLDKLATGNVMDLLTELNANVVVLRTTVNGEKVLPGTSGVAYPNDGSDVALLAGISESYTPRWEASIETMDVGAGRAFKGSILVVRHPLSGTINTLVYTGGSKNGVVPVNEEIKAANNSKNYNSLSTVLTYHLGVDDAAPPGELFKENTEVNFCVNPYGLAHNTTKETTRRNIRIVANARNASGVEVMDLDNEGPGEERNKCMTTP
ncbi:MAG: hypothetical protein Q4B65_02655 [Candidatus Saccharibacteria bacterium]|nr:hypothetical protein [Candidatus Saccharibacteria bacterium]